eukprot:scaffold104751_cov31-Tisochrysis_lutea.AAC.1
MRHVPQREGTPPGSVGCVPRLNQVSRHFVQQGQRSVRAHQHLPQRATVFDLRERMKQELAG